MQLAFYSELQHRSVLTGVAAVFAHCQRISKISRSSLSQHDNPHTPHRLHKWPAGFFNTVIQYFIPRDCHYSRNLKVTSVLGAVSQPCCLTGISQHPCLLLYEPLLFTEIIPSVPRLKFHHKYTFPSVLQSPSSARSETSLPFADMSSKKGCFTYILLISLPTSQPLSKRCHHNKHSETLA